MYAPERQQLILERARGRQAWSELCLAEELKVTSETVRRDLDRPERRGFLRRVFGGAPPVERIEMEPTLASRRGTW